MLPREKQGKNGLVRHRLCLVPPLPFVAATPPLPCASTAFRDADTAFALCFHCLSLLRHRRFVLRVPAAFRDADTAFPCSRPGWWTLASGTSTAAGRSGRAAGGWTTWSG